jgi:hypothetical protein
VRCACAQGGCTRTSTTFFINDGQAALRPSTVFTFRILLCSCLDRATAFQAVRAFREALQQSGQAQSS